MMDKLKTGSGKRLRTEALAETALPVPYDAAAMPGVSVLGTDGQVYSSIKTGGVYQWSKAPAALSTGEIFLGVSEPRTNFNYNLSVGGINFTPAIQAEGGDPDNATISTVRYTTETGPAYFVLGRVNSASPLANTAVTNAQDAGTILFMGADGTELIPGAAITANVTGTVESGSVPMQLNLRTRPEGAVTGTPIIGRLRITPDGNVLINNTAGTEKLDVTGNIKASGSLIGDTLSISGQSVRTTALQETALPIALDATTMPGASVLGTDGQIYTSAKDPAGIYRWAQGALVDSSYGVRIFVEDNIRPELSGLVLGGRERPEGFPTGPARFVLTPLRDPTPAINGSLGSIDFASRAGISESAAEITTPCRIVGATEHTLWGEGSRPTSLSISLLDANTTDRTARFRLQYDGSVLFSNALGSSMARFTAAGNLLIGNTTGTERLDVTGNIKASGSLIGDTLSISGQSVRTTALQETALPIALDATTMPGTSVLGTDGQVYVSQKPTPSGSYQWLKLAGLTNLDQLIIGGASRPVGPGANIRTLAIESGDFGGVGISVVKNVPTGSAGQIILAKTRGTAPGGTASVVDGDSLGTFSFAGTGPTGSLGSIGGGTRAQVDGAVTGDLFPVRLVFLTRTAGVENAERMRLTSAGNLLIGNTTGTERLSVTGNIQLTSTADSYKVGTDNVVGSRKTGWAAPTGTATRTTFATYAGQDVTDPPTETEVQNIDDHVKILSERLKALIDDLTSHGLIGPTP